MTDSWKEIFGSSHHSVFTWENALRTVLWVREFEPSLFEPGVYFSIKWIGKLPGPTDEFERPLVFETGEFERPKFDCIAQYPLHHVTYSTTKFEVATSNRLGGDTFTRKYIIWPLTLTLRSRSHEMLPSTLYIMWHIKLQSLKLLPLMV